MLLPKLIHNIFTLDALKVIVPIVVSAAALFITLRDRRPHLKLHARKGDWYKLTKTLSGKEFLFRGIVEVYNVSARANAIRDYAFWCRREAGDWETMESEFFHNSEDGQASEKNNCTPLALAPYSEIEVSVLAITKMPQPYEMQVRIEVQDLFGKRYRVEVTAKS